MTKNIEGRIKELKEIILEAELEIEELEIQAFQEKNSEWVGRCFRINDQKSEEGDTWTSYFWVTGIDSGPGGEVYCLHYLQINQLSVTSGMQINISHRKYYNIQFLAKHEELSQPEFKAEIKDLLRHVFPFRVELPPRSAIEPRCPCPDCCRCCCRWVGGLDENQCANFDQFGCCGCERAEEEDWVARWKAEDPDAIMTDEEVEAKISCYEKRFGMSSEEFLAQVAAGTAPDEDGIISWKLLLKYC